MGLVEVLMAVTAGAADARCRVGGVQVALTADELVAQASWQTVVTVKESDYRTG